jgi:hypothetical protein
MHASNRSSLRIAPLGLALSLTCAALAGIGGCGNSNSKLAPVQGIVRLDGKPLASGKVLFQPAAGRGATGAIRSDGTFTLGTYSESDGAIIGQHQVAVVAMQSGSAGRPDPTAQRTSLKPLVPEKYLAVGTSGLTFEVKAGANNAEIDLTTP